MADISFSTIPANELLPGVYIETAGDNPALPNQDTLLIGQTVTAQPNTPVLISSVAAAVRRFGATSQLAGMVKAYLSNDVQNNGVWCLPYADAGGAAAAAGAINVTGTATAAGTLAFYIAGGYVAIGVSVGDAGAAIATKLAAAVNGYIDTPAGSFDNKLFNEKKKKKHRFFFGATLPVSAAVDGTVTTKVNLTAVNKGTAGNAINLQANYFGDRGQETTPAGLTVAITNMTGGSGDPDISNLDAVLINTPYDFIVIPWNTTTQLNLVQTFLAGRWQANRQIYGHCFAARMALNNNAGEAVTFALTRNDPHTTVVHFEPSVPSTEWLVASAYAGAFAQSSRTDPAMPTHNLGIVGIMGPRNDNHFSYAVRETLLGDGAALMKYNNDHTSMILRAVTTYQTDSNGSPDMSYRDTETLYTLMAVNRRLKGDYLAKFPRAKLADDGTSFGPGSQFSQGLPSQPIATPNGIKSALIQSYTAMAKNDAWVDGVSFFAQNIIVQRRATDPSRIDVLYPVILIGGLRVTAVMNLFQLQAPSSAAAA